MLFFGVKIIRHFTIYDIVLFIGLVFNFRFFLLERDKYLNIKDEYMAKDKMYQAMKDIAKRKGIKASPEHDLYKMYAPYFLNAFYYEIVDKKAKKMNMNIHFNLRTN